MSGQREIPEIRFGDYDKLEEYRKKEAEIWGLSAMPEPADLLENPQTRASSD